MERERGRTSDRPDRTHSTRSHQRRADRGRYLIRWRIADLIDGRWGPLVIAAVGMLLIAALVVPLAFRPFIGRSEETEIGQTVVQCGSAFDAIGRDIPEGATPNDPVRVCVERGRARIFTAGLGTFFLAVFVFGAFLLRSGSMRRRREERPSRWGGS